MNVVGKITWRLVPFLCLLYLVNYLDRTNVAMAKLQMLADTNLTEATYGLGAGLFFVGYFIFEIPSNLILHRVGASGWLARIMISWGVCSSAMLLTRGPLSFYTLRFLLGVAEAGFFPGIVFYLTYWIPAARRSRVMALFLTSIAISGILGNPMAGGLMKLDGIGGLHGWQWLFLLEGVPPVVLGVSILLWNLLPNTPVEAKWLSADEKGWIAAQLKSETDHAHVSHVSDLRSAAADGRLWLLSAIYFLLIMGLYGFIFWVPTLVKDWSGMTDAKVGMLSAIPYIVAAVSMVAVGWHADRAGRRKGHVAVCALIGAVGMVAVAASHGTATGLVSLSVAAVGIFSVLGPFWAIPTRYLRGQAAAAGIAVINSTGALAGFVAPSAIGWAKTATGHFTAGLLLVAGSLALGGVVVMWVPASADART